MPNETTGFKSIAEALAAAEKKRRAAAAPPPKTPWFRTGAAGPAAGSGRGAPASSPSRNISDLRDEFDYAIEAVQTARKAMPHDAARAEEMATNLLMAKQKIPRREAADLIMRAIRYLDK